MAELCRVARAEQLFQLGREQEAIRQLREQELVLRGRPEVHAALAAMLYQQGRALEAEQQWAIATEFDARYQSADWVAANKHWPPRLLEALQRFLAIT